MKKAISSEEITSFYIVTFIRSLVDPRTPVSFSVTLTAQHICLQSSESKNLKVSQMTVADTRNQILRRGTSAQLKLMKNDIATRNSLSLSLFSAFDGASHVQGYIIRVPDAVNNDVYQRIHLKE